MHIPYLDNQTTLSPFGFRSTYSLPYKGSMDDNAYVIHREHLETVMRGTVEDYYFNDTLGNVRWGNYERRLSQVLTAYNIPRHLTSNVCHQPIIPLRGLYNSSHWRVHPIHAVAFADWCSNILYPKTTAKTSNTKGTRRLQESSYPDTEKSKRRDHQPPVPKATGLDNFDHFCCNRRTELLFRTQLAPMAGV